MSSLFSDECVNNSIKRAVEITREDEGESILKNQLFYNTYGCFVITNIDSEILEKSGQSLKSANNGVLLIGAPTKTTLLVIVTPQIQARVFRCADTRYRFERYEDLLSMEGILLQAFGAERDIYYVMDLESFTLAKMPRPLTVKIPDEKNTNQNTNQKERPRKKRKLSEEDTESEETGSNYPCLIQ